MTLALEYSGRMGDIGAPRRDTAWDDVAWGALGTDRTLGMAYLHYILRAQRWTHRRVDVMTFPPDHDSWSQHTSIDFTPVARPLPPITTVAGQQHVLLPFLQVYKRPLIGFDFKDSNGADVPLLTARQSRTLASLGLLALGDSVLRKSNQGGGLCINYPPTEYGSYQVNTDPRCDLDLPPLAASSAMDARQVLINVHAQRLLVDLVAGDEEEGAKALRELEKGQSAVTRTLWERRAFRVYARRLAQQYYLTGVFPIRATPEPGPEPASGGEAAPDGALSTLGLPRQVVKFDICQRVMDSRVLSRDPSPVVPAGGWTRVAQWARRVPGTLTIKLASKAALVPARLDMSLHHAEAVESYHLELSAPAGMKFVDFVWHFQPPNPGPGSLPGSVARTTKSALEIRMQVADQVRHDLVPPVASRPWDTGSGSPVVVTPDLRNAGTSIEVVRLHTHVNRVPLGYNIGATARMVPATTGSLIMTMGFATLALILQVLLTLHWAAASDLPIPFRGGLEEIAQALGTGRGTYDSYVQNRATLLLALVALAAALLVRSGEHPLTKGVLAFTRTCLVALFVGLVVSGAGMFLSPAQTGALRLPVVAPALLSVSIVCWCCIQWVFWVTSWGVARRIARRGRRIKARLMKRAVPSRGYWKVS